MHKIPVKYHFLFWIGFIILCVAILSPYYYNMTKAILHRVVFLPVWLIATYFNLFILLPKLWDRAKKTSYYICLAVLIFSLTVVQRLICIKYIYPTFFWMREPNIQELDPFWVGPFIQFAAFISLPVIISIGFRLGWKWYQENYKSKQIIAEQQAAELDYLKAQVNPHFLFNTLNSLYGLSLESSEKVPQMVLKLSNLLSYSLYESKVDNIPIQKELNLINDFIGLEKERYGDRVEVDISIDEQVKLDTSIAPLLLLPLIENAFKHGVKNNNELTIIEVELKQSSQFIEFSIQNKTGGINNSESHDLSGLGLTNLRRRLELYYPNKHSISITKTEELFRVVLKLQADV